MNRFLSLSDSCRFVDMGCSLWWQDRSVVYSCCWPSPAQSFLGPSPVGLTTIFYCLRFETSLFTTSYDSQDYGGGRTCLHTPSRVKSYVTTDGQSTTASWNKATIWGLWPDFYYCQIVAGLLMWGALPDKRTGLSFTTAAGPHHHSHSLVGVPWDSRPYFTASDSRLPFLSPPTTRRATVEVFDPASTQDY
jgi:hypothetical protein